ncbi:adenylate/guanylate cyclase domain-containing protein [Bradyrhizobium elkanii]|uniref:adenylate/guanylate cyclase domain-containing protein n=1 Tax=Bradyrhizobium elkanii TaxID=29448 RepID=UPI000841D69C|nr:adenylate/guanylate cyclase domain-containing protein [Bradyrhizobium elkanii]ODM74786.1 adenylate cyclase [Bradyrhizobium elkanii]ODM79312.1 adenylate cyclase [Bradyrhizobium elkanii]
MPQDVPRRIERRLSAILAADVAGYSRLMHEAEEATHAKLSNILTNDVEPAIADHGGRIVKNTGDGFLAEFPSAVEAVRAALRFQTRIHELTAGDADDQRIAFRVGVNIGDVIVEPHDIFGDGVNIAARLEGISEPGSICISSSVYDQVQGKTDVQFVDLGEQPLKNIARPVRAYTIARDSSSGSIRSSQNANPISFSPPRLSLVVLPLINLSGDPLQDYFVDGVTESLTTDLSRISGSFVIGRNTAFTYKGRTLDAKKIGRELNIRYVLEGSVQRNENRLRVNVQLVDAETGKHLWAQRFDKPITDLFGVQDEIVSRLANELEAELTEQEAKRSERSPHPTSMELYFQGRALLNKGWAPDHLSQARTSFERALLLDPQNTDAAVGGAIIDLAASVNYMSDDRAGLLVRAEAALIKALCIAPNHALAHTAFGALLIATKRAAQGIAECERALELDSNLAEAHVQIGYAKYLTGRGAETEGHVNEAFRLSPRDVFAYRWLMVVGLAKFQIREDAEALGWLRRSVEANRNYPVVHFFLAAGLALIGSMDEAKSAVNSGLAFSSYFTIRRFLEGAQSDHPSNLAFRDRLAQGMRLAGVPEG